MKKIVEYSIQNPVTILMGVAGILLLGYISFQRLGIELLPELNAPRLFVEIKAGEQPPAEIETQFTRHIEALVSRLNHVTEVASITRIGAARITVAYNWEADMDEAMLDLQKALNAFSQNAALDELSITQQDPNAAPVIILGFSRKTPTDLDELRRIAENYLQNELIRVEGIASVDLIGGEEKVVMVETDPYLLEAYGISTDLIANRIGSYNRTIAGGALVEMGKKYVIKGVSEFQSLDDIRNIILTYQSTQSTINAAAQTLAGASPATPVYLKEVATVTFKNADPENIVHLNQQRCMGLAIYKERKYNTVKAVAQILENLTRLKKSLPDYELTVIKNQGNFINAAIEEVQNSALVGILLAVIILYIFLRRIGVTLIISTAIPVSIIATFNLMYFNGLSLNIMTLGGLALGAGMLVDNAIVVVENITRKLETGDDLVSATRDGTAQVGGAILASTLTTVVVFLPIVYLHGAAGALFKDQAWTVTFALMSSLVVAILIIPVLGVRWLKPGSAPTTKTHHPLHFTGYSALLARILKHKTRVLIGVIVISIATYLALPFVGSEFMPRTEQNEFSMVVKLPDGSDLLRTEDTVTNIERLIQSVGGPAIQTIYSQIGPSSIYSDAGDRFFEGENTATLKIVLKSNAPVTATALIEQLNSQLNQIPEVGIQFYPEQTALQLTLGTETAPLVVEIKGTDLNQLQDLTAQVRARLSQNASLLNLTTNFDEGRPEINVMLDRTLMGMWQITPAEVVNQLKDVLSGRETTQWEYQGELKPVNLKFPAISPDQLPKFNLTTANHQKVRLDQIATMTVTQAPKQIFRRNQNRIGQVMAHVHRDRSFDQIVKEVTAELNQMDWPAEYRFQITGEELKRQEAFANLKFALILAVILVYMVLAAQFESLLQPFIIMLTVPLAGIGAIWLFLLLRQSFNIMSYIGMILLAGIVVNNSIILVDAMNQLRQAGTPHQISIIQAAQMRIRPILMTSLTTILALAPLSLGLGESAALRAPMALAIIGGLTSATLLTLVVIPVLLAFLDQMRSSREKATI
ncbi:efflux RND transporter permease subunit [candidate division KSB1 bacterium]|nr:efflux RND transporter permease subunit [candidate division KSB1 bacterium]